jgi:2,3-dihydroxyphenylpropionate 1,2-dioxygenase
MQRDRQSATGCGGSDYFNSLLGRQLLAARPDVLVVFGPDHFRTLFYDNMPAWCIGVGRVDGWGDWETPTGPFATAPGFARHLVRHLLDHDFDPAYSYALQVDHGISEVPQLCELPDLPLVPVLLNTSAPPMPTPARCYAFGQAVGQAIAACEEPLRIAVVGSGGLSHSPPMVSVESEDPAHADQVQRLIHGRGQVLADARAREERLIRTVAQYAPLIRPDWDRAFLARICRGEAAALARELDWGTLEAEAGNGGQEVRTWLAMAGTVGSPPMELLGYEPIPFLITGMGAVVARLQQGSES